MAKKYKAYVVGFCPMTRVIVEDTGNEKDMEEKAIDKAIFKMKNDISYYIHRDHLTEVTEDLECPFTESEL